MSDPERPPWWALLPPAQARVSCGEQAHQLRWSGGKLIALDHPDAEGERVLAALGGDRSECLDLVESWGAHSDDLEVLAIGPRSAADELTLDPEEAAQLQYGVPWRPPGRAAGAYAQLRVGAVLPGLLRARLLPHRAPPPRASAFFSGARTSHMIRATHRHPPGKPERDAERRAKLLSVLALGAEFQFRLSATVAAAWADGGSRAGDAAVGRPALVAALAGRAAPAAAAWLGTGPDLVDVVPHEGPGWGRLEDGGQRLTVALPVGWLASVWAAGLAVTAGHLVVAVTEASWPDATVLGVPEPGADPVILNVHAAEGHGAAWTLRQRGAAPTVKGDGEVGGEGACD
jgi:hypothetical protein